MRAPVGSSAGIEEDDISVNSGEYDMVKDADDDKNIFRTKVRVVRDI